MENKNTQTIITDSLILRRAELKDADALFNLLSDDVANTYLPWFVHKTKAETQNFIERVFLSHYSKNVAYRYVICQNTDNKAIGYVLLSADESRDFGYAVDRQFWRRGIATQAASAVVDTLKQHGHTYITATHDVNNKYSCEVMKNIGMQYTYSYEEKSQP